MTLNRPTQLLPYHAIRLRELSVYNWGSFHGLHTASIDAGGTLITGDNGAGKSSLIDGLMALLLPAGKATFNMAAAQGDRSDRSLMSYVRGHYGSAHEGNQTRVLSKRDGAVVTGVRALYQTDEGVQMTLAALFWINHTGHALSDLKRVYLVARRPLALKELLDAFGEGDPRALKVFLRNDKAITCCDDRFSEYQESYRRLLCLDNPNAPALLARALGLKKIDDLTALIRTLVLEPSQVRDDARKAVDGFADLVGIHNQLLDARKRRDALADLPAVEHDLQRSEQAVQQHNAQLHGLAAWFGEQCAALWQQRIALITAELQQAERQLITLKQATEEATARQEQCHADYLQAGGERIEIIKRDLKGAEDKLVEVHRQAARYQKMAQALKLDKQLNQAVFEHNLQQARLAGQTIIVERQQAQTAFAEQAAQYSNRQAEAKQLEQEIKAIEARPDSNISTAYQRLRDELVATLDMTTEALMFIGELIDVQPEHGQWQGAIERALGGLRCTLLVPENGFTQVTRWLNQRHTGLHVRVQVVYALKDAAHFKQDGFLRKLNWRKHPYRDWLKQHLARFDLHCVADTDSLDKTPFSITQQGLLHLEQGRFEKKDQQHVDDRRAWQLGFSNLARLQLLRQDQTSLQQSVQQAKKTESQARLQMNAVGQREQQWQALAECRWADIDVPHWQHRIEQCQQDIQQLQQAGGDLAQAMTRWQTAKQASQSSQDKQNQQQVQIGSLDAQHRAATQQQQRCLKQAEQHLDDSLRTALLKRIGAVQDKQLDQASKLEATHRQDLTQERDLHQTRQHRASNKAVGIITGFRTQWPVVAADWGGDLASLPDYLRHLQQLDAEGLPALVDKFRARLNHHTTQSLASIRTRIDDEREEISERITTINQVLTRTEFHPGSFLRLGIKNDQYEHVQHFNRLLNQVMEQLNSDDHEARFDSLQQVISILDKASNPATANTMESRRLLDPRHQLSFYAEEIDASDDTVRDVLMSSSGKSGGEKEAFAGTIVAASLAYVLTPAGSERPVYCTVFLDEAFSNTAEAVSRRVLRVFKELHLHVNLITPYKNLNLARESARSLLIAERDSSKHESRLCEVSWKTIDQHLQRQADRLGVTLHTPA